MPMKRYGGHSYDCMKLFLDTAHNRLDQPSTRCKVVDIEIIGDRLCDDPDLQSQLEIYTPTF